MSEARGTPHVVNELLSMSEEQLKRVVAASLKISVERVSDALEFSGVPEWNSLAHISLMLALEGEYRVDIPDDLVLELTSYPAIRDFILRGRAGEGAV